MLKLLRAAPFVRFLLFLISGILIQVYFNLTSYFLFFPLLGLLLILLSFITKIAGKYKFRFLFGLGLFFLLFSTGIFIQDKSSEKVKWTDKTDVYLYEGLLIEEPILKPKTIQCKLKIINSENTIFKQAINKKVVIYVPIDSISRQLKVGDRLLFYGKLEKSPLFLERKSFAASGFVRMNHWIQIENNSSISLKIKSLSVRRSLLNQLKKIIPDEKQYSLAVALMFGYKQDLDNDLRQSFANIGAGHILAVSGMHFSIIFGMFYFLLSFTGNTFKGKIIKQLILFPMIWGYAFVTGLPPSVIRAALMMNIWSLGDLFFNRSFTLNTLAISAFFMLLYEPFYLFDVGFQLSYSAVFSIVLLNPYLVKLYKSRNRIISYFWNLSCVSITAQIGVLPLSIYYFNQIPLIFLITNYFLVPLVTIILCLIPFNLLFFALLGEFWIVAYPLNKILAFFLNIVDYLDRLPNRNIDNLSITLFELFLLYGFLISLIFLLLRKRIIYIYLLVIIVLLQLNYYLC